MPVGLLCFMVPYFVLLLQQIIQYLRHLCTGRAAPWVQLASAAGNGSGLDQCTHGLSRPACHLAAVSEIGKGLPIICSG